MELKTLQKKWKIINTTPLSEGSYWMTGSDVIDLTNLSSIKSETNTIYLEKNDGRSFIKYIDNDAYLEIVELTKDDLRIKLHGMNQDTKEKGMTLMIECKSIGK